MDEKRRMKHILNYFLGVCIVYRSFVSGYNNIIEPLNLPLKAEYPEKIKPLSDYQDGAFLNQINNEKMTHIFDFTSSFFLYRVKTDASAYQVGASKFQTDERYFLQ